MLKAPVSVVTRHAEPAQEVGVIVSEGLTEVVDQRKESEVHEKRVPEKQEKVKVPEQVADVKTKPREPLRGS